jgi:hypothetical protein
MAGVRLPAGERDFSFLYTVQAGSGAYPASYTEITLPSIFVKRGQPVTYCILMGITLSRFRVTARRTAAYVTF